MSIASPAHLTVPVTAVPPSDMTDISAMPPPRFAINTPWGLSISIPAPIAAAIVLFIMPALLIPVLNTRLSNAFFSTSVTSDGTHINALGMTIDEVKSFFKNITSISSADVKSAITPSFIGEIISFFPEILPNISYAFCPHAFISSLSTAIIDGSFTAMPFPAVNILIFDVPISIAKSDCIIISSIQSFSFNRLFNAEKRKVFLLFSTILCITETSPTSINIFFALVTAVYKRFL